MASKKIVNRSSESVATERAVVVFTARRGVFFGYTSETSDAIIARTTATFQRCRMCTYWSAATKGALGLASIGPQAGSKIGPQVPQFTAESITGIAACSAEAVKVWEAAPWS
jgi:hypothetical protein